MTLFQTYQKTQCVLEVCACTCRPAPPRTPEWEWPDPFHPSLLRSGACGLWCVVQLRDSSTPQEPWARCTVSWDVL